MKSTYTSDELFQTIPGDDENVMFIIPPEICDLADIKIGDEVEVEVENESLIIRKL